MPTCAGAYIHGISTSASAWIARRSLSVMFWFKAARNDDRFGYYRELWWCSPKAEADERPTLASPALNQG